MELVRALYEKMRRVTVIYRAVAAVAVVAALLLGAKYTLARRDLEASRHQAAEIFYQLKSLELEVLRSSAGTPVREELARRRARLEATYDEWLRRLDETSRGSAEEQAIRAAVARLGEARVLASENFVRDVRRRVAQWRRTPDYARVIRTALDAAYPPRIEAALAAAHLPRDLLWVAFQESRFRTDAVGPETRFGYAKGMWQIMPATARQYGLRTGPLVGQPLYDPADQRHDFQSSTAAAIRYMTDLYALDAQGSGLLVMACYNAGQTRVLALLRSLPADPRERNFWRLLERYRDRIPDETYGYVVGVVAASAVATEPEAFGMERVM
jgi:membrane-bound lytic murein transglycosylase D